MSFAVHDLSYLIADISGYTGFVVSHRKAVVHSQMVVAELLRTLVEQATPPVAFSRLEGDAVFAYALKDGIEPEEFRKATGEFVRRCFSAFERNVKALASEAICKCPACGSIKDLKLKIIMHSGQGVVTDIVGSKEFAGVDVIVVHRLLKNSVEADEYLLVTDDAKADIALGPKAEFIAGEEDYAELGTVKTWVADPQPLLDVELRRDESERASRLAYEVLRHEIRREYADVADVPEKGFHFHTGRFLATRLGYSEQDMESVPESALESFAGTGNPFALGEIPAGSKVVDIGCGAGFDTFLAANRVGPEGRVVGVDMTPEMLAKAKAGVAAGGYENIEIRAGLAEDIPVADGWADFVISNGVINLCPSKPPVFAEIFRILKPGGRMQIGDILVDKPIPESARRDIDLWTS